MSEVSTLTIVFRGLMIFHVDKQNDRMEIGILRAPGHVPRILKLKNGVLESVFDLRLKEKDALDDEQHPVWRIDVPDPAEAGVRIYTNGSVKFDRRNHKDDRDFRWIMNLEGEEFYNADLTQQLNTREKLKPVLHVSHGEFYTRLKTPALLRKTHENGAGTATGGGTTPEPPSRPFGAVAAVTGCDISLKGNAKLVVADETGDRTLFTFVNEPNTIYEFTNTPPDVKCDHVVGEATHDHAHGGGHDHGHVPAGGQAEPRDHFQHYYNLFTDKPAVRFEFFPRDPDPGPDPALCGKGQLGTRTVSLLEGAPAGG